MLMFRFYQSCLLLFTLCGAPLFLTGQVAGIPDLTFGQSGEVLLGDTAANFYGGYMALLPDGKIIVGGDEYDSTLGSDIPAFIRLLPDGSIDTDYGVNGHAYPVLSPIGSGHLFNIALTAENKLVIVGSLNGNTLFVARLDSDGNLDPGFGQNGLLTFDSLSGYFLGTILIKPDGKILLGGSKEVSNSNSDLLVVQLLPDGTLDPNFGTAGVTRINLLPGFGFEYIADLALQADGKVVTIGSTFGKMQVVRFQADGTLDTTFANHGSFMFGYPDDIEQVLGYSIAVQADQKILLCGQQFQNSTGVDAVALFRLQSDGNFDTGFGANGRAYAELGKQEAAQGMTIQPDGKIIVGASSKQTELDPEGWLWVIRFEDNGEIDPTFGNAGYVQTPLYEQYSGPIDLLLQPDGKILHLGHATSKLTLWRYLNDLSVGVKDLQLADFQIQCSPNPVSNQADLRWVQAVSGEVRSELYDAQGRLLQILLPSTLSVAGEHHLTINFQENIPAGVCFLMLQVGEERQVLRLTKI